MKNNITVYTVFWFKTQEYCRYFHSLTMAVDFLCDMAKRGNPTSMTLKAS